MNIALAAGGAEEEDETVEDTINRIMEARKMLPNASYFAFTATPKNKTLEIFGEPSRKATRSSTVPFHSYTMKQAIQEGFILDVLKNYTPVNSYYRLMKTVEDDPEFDTKRAQKKLRRYVECHDHAIRHKAEIMVDHFHDQVIALSKIGGEARAMVVTSGIERAIQYFHAFQAYLKERKSPYQAIVAFSGEHEYGGAKVTEAIAQRLSEQQDRGARFKQDPYRFLICRRQVPDRLRRAAAAHDVRGQDALRHQGGADAVAAEPGAPAKARHVRARLHERCRHDQGIVRALLSHDDPQRGNRPEQAARPEGDLDGYQVYAWEQVDDLVALYLGGADRDKLDPILDACVAVYKADLDEDGQVDFKGKAKAFARTYGFLASILPYTNAEWEKLSIFLNFLIPKLPAPKEEDLSKGILEAIDMDSYRVESAGRHVDHTAGPGRRNRTGAD